MLVDCLRRMKYDAGLFAGYGNLVVYLLYVFVFLVVIWLQRSIGGNGRGEVLSVMDRLYEDANATRVFPKSVYPIRERLSGFCANKAYVFTARDNGDSASTRSGGELAYSVVCKEAAAGALRNLTYNNNVNRNAMAAAGAVPILVDMCKQGENEMSQMHAAALLKNLTSSPQCIAAVAKELGLGDPNAASKTDVDAEVDGLLHVSRAAAPAAPTSPTSPGSGRFKMAAKLVSQLTPKSSPTRAGGRISKNKFSNSSAK